jgi:hypothetical protein
MFLCSPASIRSCATALTIAAALGTLATSEANAWELPVVDLKIGLRGGANIAYMANPPDSDELYQYQFTLADSADSDPRYSTYVPYENYYGVGWNLGAAINLRFIDIVGLEIGYQRATESARGTVELADVRDCQYAPSNPCYRQEVEQEFSLVAHHIPIVAQVYLPLGVARPFISLGVDVVASRTDRQLAVNARSPLPSQLDPNNEDQAATLNEWNNSPLGQNVLRSELNPDSPEVFGGFIAGLGVDIALKRIEIPVEFRMHLYPATGASTTQRGEFGTPCPRDLAATGACPDPLSLAAPQYNDVWTTQFFILFGLDYLLF